MTALVLITFEVTIAQTGQTETLNASIPEIASLRIRIDGNSTIPLSVSVPGAGSPLTGTPNSASWLGVTTVVGAGKKGTISVRINRTIPGLDLKLTVAPCTSFGAGLKGNVASNRVLSLTDQPMITDMGSLYTGGGVGYGYNLTYWLAENGMEQIRGGSNLVVVIYTYSSN
jgi:hypothetical protein